MPRLPRKNDMTACFETFNKDGFCSFPHRHCDRTTEASDPRQRHVGPSKPAFRARPPQISHCAASKSTFSFKFSSRTDLKIDVSCEASVDFHHLSQNATPATEYGTSSPLRAALTMRFAKNTHHNTSEVLRLPRKMRSEVSKVLRLLRKMQRIF